MYDLHDVYDLHDLYDVYELRDTDHAAGWGRMICAKVYRILQYRVVFGYLCISFRSIKHARTWWC